MHNSYCDRRNFESVDQALKRVYKALGKLGNIRGRGTGGGGGNGGMCPPTFLKVKKVPFFSGLKRKKYFLSKRPLFLERKCPFRSRLCKGHFRRYRDSIISGKNFRSARERHTEIV